MQGCETLGSGFGRNNPEAFNVQTELTGGRLLGLAALPLALGTLSDRGYASSSQEEYLLRGRVSHGSGLLFLTWDPFVFNAQRTSTDGRHLKGCLQYDSGSNKARGR
jgi:hypothetical protein